MSFEFAKFELFKVLSTILEKHWAEMEGTIGVHPEDMWPYCKSAVASSDALVRLSMTDFPEDAGVYVAMFMFLANDFDSELMDARRDERSKASLLVSQAKCDEFFVGTP